MNTLDLELKLETNTNYGSPLHIDLPVSVHIHKRIEQFIYTNTIQSGSIPISYNRSPDLDALNNLLILNRSHCVLANSPKLFVGETKHDVVTATSYSSEYSSILATDQTFTDSHGKDRPLFYRHALPEGVIEATVSEVTRGNKSQAGEGYRVDIEERSIYTNYRNQFDIESGSYRLFYVSGSTENGEAFNTLLNAEPVAQEATWEDIDLETGALVTSYPLYTRVASGRGFTYQFNRGAKWYIKPESKGLLQPLKPRAKTPKQPWFIRFSNGDLSTYVNGSVHRYRIPEYNTQPFIPYNPILFGSSQDLLFVNKRVLAATRHHLKVDPDVGLHLEVRIQDADGVLIKAYTTNTSLEGERVSDLDVFYETDKIASWDNSFGFIALAVDILPGWDYTASYYYEATDFEYTSVDLNPVTNRKLRDHMYVFYCVPDVEDSDRSIHYLIVNYDGVIVACSQTQGLALPNLQLKNTDGSYNVGTVIGMSYFSETETSFLDQYSAGFTNTNAYMILAEITATDTSLLEDQFIVDVRRPGAIIKEANYQEAVEANPRILQSQLGYGETGQVVPETNVVILEPPIRLLEDYGGVLTLEQAEAMMRTNMIVSGYTAIRWTYPTVELTVSSFTNSQVDITATWEGAYTYKLYRRSSDSDAWVLLSTAVEPAEATLVWADTSLESGFIYQYAVSISENSIEYPMCPAVIVEVR